MKVSALNPLLITVETQDTCPFFGQNWSCNLFDAVWIDGKLQRTECSPTVCPIDKGKHNQVVINLH